MNFGKQLWPSIQLIRNGQTWAIGEFTEQQIAVAHKEAGRLHERFVAVMRFENASMFL